MADVHRRVFSAEHLVLVELYGASQATNDPLLHALETIARRYVGRLDVVRLDALEAPSIAAEFFVSGLPALLLYQCGRVVDRIVGEVPMHRIIAMSEAHIRAA